MILHLCVILFKGGGFPACITGHMTSLQWGLHQWGSASRGVYLQVMGVCLNGGLYWGLGRPSPTLELEKRAVFILLECFLVLFFLLLFSAPFLPPATKLGQDNIFRSVCQEFCSHPGAVHVGRYGLQADGTHPTGMHSCLFGCFLPKCKTCCPFEGLK